MLYTIKKFFRFSKIMIYGLVIIMVQKNIISQMGQNKKWVIQVGLPILTIINDTKNLTLYVDSPQEIILLMKIIMPLMLVEFKIFLTILMG